MGGRLMSVVAGEVVLIYSRLLMVVHSQPTWEVMAGCRGTGRAGVNSGSREEELLFLGLVLEIHHPLR